MTIKLTVSEAQIETVKEYTRLTERERSVCFNVLFNRNEIYLDAGLKARVRDEK
jgi:hypothetical protein